MTTKKPDVKVTHHTVSHHTAAPTHHPPEPKPEPKAEAFKAPPDLEQLQVMAKSDPARTGRLIDQRFGGVEAKEIRALIRKNTGVEIP